MVDENTSPGSVLDIISWIVRKLVWQKNIIFDPHKFIHFFTELLSFIRYFHTCGQQDSVDLYFSGFAGRRPAKPVLKQGTRKKSVTTTTDDGRTKTPPPIHGRSIFILVLFSRFGPMSDFFVSQKVFSRQNSMILA